mmetsp:Transcript_68454/g.198533  ORF Transcript_68454/g.198533 Transcript_68454/m.198533 type:complete len:221 (+) Transcript_68454:207-869(+)
MDCAGLGADSDDVLSDEQGDAELPRPSAVRSMHGAAPRGVSDDLRRLLGERARDAQHRSTGKIISSLDGSVWLARFCDRLGLGLGHRLVRTVQTRAHRPFRRLDRCGPLAGDFERFGLCEHSPCESGPGELRHTLEAAQMVDVCALGILLGAGVLPCPAVPRRQLEVSLDVPGLDPCVRVGASGLACIREAQPALIRQRTGAAEMRRELISRCRSVSGVW